MERFFTLIFLICLFISFPVTAQNKVAAHNKKTRRDSTTVTIQFNASYTENTPVDSAFVIFDKHNLTGAGTIKRIYYPVNNQIVISDVPEGKYYIDVVCLGVYQQSFREVSYVYDKRKNKNLFRFNLKPGEKFDPATVYIPPETINAARLTVLKPSLHE